MEISWWNSPLIFCDNLSKLALQIYRNPTIFEKRQSFFFSVQKFMLSCGNGQAIFVYTIPMKPTEKSFGFNVIFISNCCFYFTLHTLNINEDIQIKLSTNIFLTKWQRFLKKTPDNSFNIMTFFSVHSRQWWVISVKLCFNIFLGVL